MVYENEQQTTNSTVTVSHLSIITLNVNGLNAPTKRQILTKWIQKKTPIYALYK